MSTICTIDTASAARRITALTLGLSLGLAGCTLGPDYVRPTQDVPQHYRGQSDGDSAAASATMGAADWQAIYPEAALQALIDEALNSNLDLRIAATRIEQADALLGVARLRQAPQVDAAGAVARNKASVSTQAPGQSRVGERGSVALNLSWELDFWGRLRRLSQAAQAELLATQHAQTAVRVSLIANVASAYYGLCALDERTDAAARSAKTREAFLELTQAQFTRGVISGLDVASAEAQLAAAQASLQDLARQTEQTENALALLLARRLQPIERGTCAAPHALPAGLPSALLERRPDVLQAEAALIAANARIGAAKAALFPSLSLTSSVGLLSNNVSQLLHQPAETWSLGVGLLQPLLDADRSAYQVDAAQARTQELMLQYEKTLRTAFVEVANAIVAQNRYTQMLAVQQAQADALRRAVEIAQARYKSGYSSYFDVISADRDLFTVEQAVAQVRLTLRLANVDLYRALGGGWSPDANGAATSAEPSTP